jgi:FG-GAP repeat
MNRYPFLLAAARILFACVRARMSAQALGRSHVYAGALFAAAFLLLAGSTTTVAQVADYNGDGKSDILLRNADGSATAILMNGAVVTAAGTVWGPGTVQAVP